ncbi:arginine N-succinyltransferase [Roseimaritima ulvae]|uniref:Arginine N-succinyltransferase n=1 Tax=Roseimaritima ulvae TaxID=980254 RepID=A0A5B9QKI8_9BACT|nr:arginine N-succinyltransferase [Roseimaritima ulvae]QEG38509.1 Arginine N-succinyltransferase [Roseimaritima ulvae]
MEIVRAVQLSDLPALLQLIGRATEGLTTLQLDEAQLLERVERSHFAFTRRSESPAGEPYVLVMEDTDNQQIVGTATLYAKTGGYEPFYAFRMQTEVHQSASLPGGRREHTALHLERTYDGPSELGSLFLLRAYRGQGRGRLLSLSRFALLAQRPHRFADRVIAEMRGRCDDAGVSPFWDAVMRPFFGVDFTVADALSTVSKSFIEDLMPRYPLYLELLPAEAQQVVGAVHRETEPAIAMLQTEGFEMTDLIDIFDAGPVVQCPVDQIQAVRRCQRCTLRIERVAPDTPRQIVSSLATGFRAALVPVATQAGIATLEEQAADALQVGDGDTVWTMTTHAAPQEARRT